MSKNNLVDSALSELYGYDNLNQLTSFSRGVLSDANSDGLFDTVASPTRTQAWSLDALGNWSTLTTNGTSQSRTHNAQNQVTGVGSTSLSYDANGSMTADESGRVFVYDAWNRLVAVRNSSNSPIVGYSYDALSRRIIEDRPNANTVDHLYFSAGWQVLEERRNGTASGDVRRQYFWSIDYVDALTSRVDYASGAVSAVLHTQYDANWNVTAIADATSGVLERYTYDPYGVVTVLYANWSVRGGSPYGWNYLHQGGRFDVDSNLYNFRHRDYSATLSRWTQNDPIGFDAGDLNLYRYVGNGPLNGVDPWGLREIPEVGMGSGRGGPKNPGRPGNPNGRPVSPDNDWMDEFIFYDYWYYLTHPLEGSTGMVVAKGGLAVTALGTGSLACGLALSGSAATGAITKTTFIGTGGTHFIVKIGEKAYEGLGQKGAIRIFPLRPYEFPRTTYWNTITFPLRYPQRGIEYAEKAGVTTYNCLSAAVKIVWKAF